MLDFSLSDEQKALIDTARRFSRERIAPVAAECDREARFPRSCALAAHDFQQLRLRSERNCAQDHPCLLQTAWEIG